jgi:hypothetical protein
MDHGMTRDGLADLLEELAVDLDAMDHPWRLIGSAALMVAGVDWPSCQDIDILTTSVGAQALEARWASRRDAGYPLDGEAPFRSRFSAYDFAHGRVELMGDLMVRGPYGWTPLDPGPMAHHLFAGRMWPAPDLEDQVRILKTFGRPKDLEKAAVLEAHILDRPQQGA